MYNLSNQTFSMNFDKISSYIVLLVYLYIFFLLHRKWTPLEKSQSCQILNYHDFVICHYIELTTEKTYCYFIQIVQKQSIYFLYCLKHDLHNTLKQDLRINVFLNLSKSCLVSGCIVRHWCSQIYQFKSEFALNCINDVIENFIRI